MTPTVMRKRIPIRLTRGPHDERGPGMGRGYDSSSPRRDALQTGPRPEFDRSELIAQCTALGYRQMIAVIGDSANAASIKRHEALGFTMAANLRSVGRKRAR